MPSSFSILGKSTRSIKASGNSLAADVLGVSGQCGPYPRHERWAIRLQSDSQNFGPWRCGVGVPITQYIADFCSRQLMLCRLVGMAMNKLVCPAFNHQRERFCVIDIGVYVCALLTQFTGLTDAARDDLSLFQGLRQKGLLPSGTANLMSKCLVIGIVNA
jgi:hypothetical protein